MQDFSDAHRRGLQIGFAKVVIDQSEGESWLDLTEEELAAKGEAILVHVKGCLFHFMQSAKRMSKKGVMIPRGKAERFMALAKCMLTPSKKKFDATIKALKKEFPKVTTSGRRKHNWTGCGWLEWWTGGGGVRGDAGKVHGAIIFPTKKKLGSQTVTGQ